jgi:hypothetical protein
MIDREEWLSGGEREPLSCEKSDHHSADQTRTGRRGHGIHIIHHYIRVSQNLLDQGGKNLDMRPRSDFRNHAAEGLVSAILSYHRLRDHAPIARHERDRAVVAAAFQSQDDGRHCSHFATGPLPHPLEMP